MESNAVNETTPERAPSVLDDAQALWHELHTLIHDHLQLAALETRRAGESLVTMLVAGFMVALLLIGAWLGLGVAAVQWLIEQGMLASSAILLAVAVNLLVVLLLCAVIRNKSRYLQFPALLRSFQPLPQKHRNMGKS
jgi:uncharacterized membrane protein YqjE